MLAALMVALATLVLVSATLMFALAARGFTGLGLAAVFGTLVHAGLAIVGGAGCVLAGTLMVAVMLTHHRSVYGAVHTLLGSIVVAAGRHAKSKSSSGNSG